MEWHIALGAHASLAMATLIALLLLLASRNLRHDIRAKDFFTQRSDHNLRPGEIPVAYVDNSFKEWFFSMKIGQRVEYSFQTEAMIEAISSSKVIRYFGGDDVIEITLNDLRYLLLSVMSGENKILSFEASNIVFIRDTSKALRAVLIVWDHTMRGWSIYAYAVDDTIVFAAGTRIVYPRFTRRGSSRRRTSFLTT